MTNIDEKKLSHPLHKTGGGMSTENNTYKREKQIKGDIKSLVSLAFRRKHKYALSRKKRQNAENIQGLSQCLGLLHSAT